jgi:hypothetical protein
MSSKKRNLSHAQQGREKGFVKKRKVKPLRPMSLLEKKEEIASICSRILEDPMKNVRVVFPFCQISLFLLFLLFAQF